MTDKTCDCGLDPRRDNDGYLELERMVAERFEYFKGVPVFTTDAEGLFEAFLGGIPDEARQYYNCHSCKEFINKYGGLVTLTESGSVDSTLWSELAPEFFRQSMVAMNNIIMRSRITGVFVSSDKMLGHPITGIWTHFHAVNPNPYQGRLYSANQVAADKRADFVLLKDSLREYPLTAVNQAVLLLKTDSLYRSEKVLGVAEWFQSLHKQLESVKNGKIRDNIVWKAVATAAPGFCHLKNTMIGTLLDDLVSGLDYEDVSRRFAAKMHPLQYQRPQADPTVGNIARAEEIVKKLGIERSLVRRFARLDEIQAMWKPFGDVKPKKATDGVFSHLTPKGQREPVRMTLPTQTITWKKFSEEILPITTSIELYVPDYGSFCALVTAQYDDAPPIIQWDDVDHRNPFSHYFYSGGSTADRWNLRPGYCKVTAICSMPSEWQPGCDHHKHGIIFVLDGARDSNYERSSNALFPEILKSELREVRSTIEAYSKSAHLQGYDKASACGMGFGQGSSWNIKLKVTGDLGVMNYKIDRYD